MIPALHASCNLALSSTSRGSQPTAKSLNSLVSYINLQLELNTNFTLLSTYPFEILFSLEWFFFFFFFEQDEENRFLKNF